MENWLEMVVHLSVANFGYQSLGTCAFRKKSMGKVPLLFQGQTTYKEDLSLKAICSSFQVRKNLSRFEW